MESIQSKTEGFRQLGDLRSAIEMLTDSIAAKPPSRLDRAKELIEELKSASTIQDKLSDLLKEITASELVYEQTDQKLADSGYQQPKDHPLGIPNSLNEANCDAFDFATKLVLSSPQSDLRTQAMFLVSLCNSLMFERSLVEQELLEAREGRRKAVQEIMVIQQKQNKANSASSWNLRTGD